MSFQERKSDSSEALGVDMTVTASGRPGVVNLEGRVSGKLGISFKNVGGNEDTIEIAFIPGSLTELQNKLSRGFSQLPSSLDGVQAANASFITSQIRDKINNLNSIKLSLWYQFFGFHRDSWGDTPVNFQESINFQPIPVVETPDTRWDLDSLPDITLVVKAKPTGFLQRSASGALNDVPTVEIDIPTSVFLQSKDISNFGCADLYPKIESEISSLKNKVESANFEARSDRNQLEDIRDSIMSSASGASSIGEVGPSVLKNFDRGKLKTWKSTVNSTVENHINVSSAERSLSNLRDDVSNNVPGSCAEEFNNTLDEVKSNLDAVARFEEQISSLKPPLSDLLSNIPALDCASEYSNISDNISSLRSKVNNLDNISPSKAEDLLRQANSIVSDIESNVPSDSPCREQFLSSMEDIKGIIKGNTGTGLSCADVSRSIRNAVGGFEASVEQYTKSPKIRRTKSRKNRLVSTGQSLVDRVENNVKDENPCKDRLKSRVRDSINKLQNAQTRPESAIPCSDKYPDLDDRIDQLEKDSIGMGAGINNSEVKQILDEANSITSTIQSQVPSDDSCRQKFASRVNGVVDRVSRMGGGVRLNLSDVTTDEGTASETVNNLKEQLQSIKSSE